MHSVALLTASYAKDIERFSLLSESIDTWLTGYTRHYVLVNDWRCRCSSGSRPTSASSFRRRAICRNGFGRCHPPCSSSASGAWLSLLSSPVHGWHIQQILKIAGVLNAPEQRVCILDSDNLFFREFDVGQYAGAERTPLFVTPKGIDTEHPLHVLWLRTVDQLSA